MSRLRKDHVAAIPNFFTLFLIGASCFLSAEHIKVFTHTYIANSTTFVKPFYVTFALLLTFTIFFTIDHYMIMYKCIYYILVLNGTCTLLLLLGFTGNFLYYTASIAWAFLSAPCVIPALYFASYHISGIQGLLLGLSGSYITVYLLFDFLRFCAWVWGSDTWYNTVAKVYMVIRTLVTGGCFYMFQHTLKENHGLEHEILEKERYKPENDGDKLGFFYNLINSRHRKDHFAQRFGYRPLPFWEAFDFKEHKWTFNNFWGYVLLFVFLPLTCSLFVPSMSASNWLLTSFGATQVGKVEHWGNFLGCLFGALLPPKYMAIWFVAIIYAIAHLPFTIFTNARLGISGVSTAVSAWAFYTGFVGSALTTIILCKLFTRHFKLDCKYARNKCCMDDEDAYCICQGNQMRYNCGSHDRFCSEDGKTSVECCIWIPQNNAHQFNRLESNSCELCSLYSSFPNAPCMAKAQASQQPRSPPQPNSQPLRCNFILRNARVSVCPYCDLTILLECEKLECTCTDKTKRQGTCPNDCGEKASAEAPGASADSGITMYSLKLDRDNQTTFTLQTPHNTYQTFTRASCISAEAAASRPNCATTPAQPAPAEEKKSRKDREIRHFKVSEKFLVGSCCHYDLKILVACVDTQEPFHAQQEPYKDKFSPIGAVVLNSSGDAIGVTNGNADKLKTVTRLCAGEENSKNTISGHIYCCSLNHQKDDECVDESCKNPGCNHIKVWPTDLPFQLKKAERYRNHVIAILCSSFIVYMFFRFFLGLIFAISEQRGAAKLTTTFSGFIKHGGGAFHSANYTMDPNFKKLKPQVQKNRMNATIHECKLKWEMMEYASTPQTFKTIQAWGNGQVKKLREENVDPGNRPRHYAQLAAFHKYVHEAVAMYALAAGTDLCRYLDWLDKSFWDAEYGHYQVETRRQVQVMLQYAKRCIPYATNDTRQREDKDELKRKRDEVWRKVGDKAEEVRVMCERMGELDSKLKEASEKEKLEAHLKVWDYRMQLLLQWIDEDVLFFNWTYVFQQWRLINIWRGQFMEYYELGFDLKAKRDMEAKASSTEVRTEL